MYLKVLEDPNDLLHSMFYSDFKNNRLHTDIILYLEYGENVRWKYNKDENTFIITQNNNYLYELTSDQWKLLLKKYDIIYNFDSHIIRINININRRNINVVDSNNNFVEQFINLLDQCEIKYESANNPYSMSEMFFEFIKNKKTANEIDELFKDYKK